MTRQEAGRLGGLATKASHSDTKDGLTYWQVIGAKGGRPRALTLAEVKRSHPPREDMDTSGIRSLATLMRLWEERQREKLAPAGLT